MMFLCIDSGAIPAGKSFHCPQRPIMVVGAIGSQPILERSVKASNLSVKWDAPPASRLRASYLKTLGNYELATY